MRECNPIKTDGVRSLRGLRHVGVGVYRITPERSLRRWIDRYRIRPDQVRVGSRSVGWRATINDAKWNSLRPADSGLGRHDRNNVTPPGSVTHPVLGKTLGFIGFWVICVMTWCH